MSRTSRPRGARLLVLVTTGAALAVSGAAPLAVAAPDGHHASAAVTTGGGFVPLTPTRVIDTRAGTGAPRGKVGAGASITSSMASRAGLPAPGGASAVVLDLTSVNSTAATYLTAHPGGSSVPPTSSVNVVAGRTTTNLVTVVLSSTGTVSISNRAGATDIVADIVGYYASTENASYGGLTTLTPYAARAFDSRRAGVTFGTGDHVDIDNDFSTTSTDYNADITGWVVDVTAVDPTGSGYVTAWSGTGTEPLTTAVSFTPGVTTSGLVEIPRGSLTVGGRSLPSFRLQTTASGGRTGLVVDIVGTYTKPGVLEDARFAPLRTPVRIVDTRGPQAPDLLPGANRVLPDTGVGSASTRALAANVTVAGAGAPTWVTTWSGGADEAHPPTSSINAARGQVVANAAIIATTAGANGSFMAYNAAGTTPFLVDVAGTFELRSTPAASAAVLAVRPQATVGRPTGH